MHFVDLHTHVLPGLDDGAPDQAASDELIAGLLALGFTEICATPHQKANQYLPALDAIQAAYQHVSSRHAAVATLAAENMWDDVFLSRLRAHQIPSYANGPAFLFELPLSPALPVGLADELFRLQTKGAVPVMAHPERYQALWGNLPLCETLSRHAAFVVDLGAIAGGFGPHQKRAAHALLGAGLVHAVTSDAHGMDDIALAGQALAWLQKHHGAAKMQRLLVDNPRAILAGEMPDPVS